MMMSHDIFGKGELHSFYLLEEPVLINQYGFSGVSIGQHYKIKHSHYINDPLIINLIKQLHNTDYPHKNSGYIDKVNQKILGKSYEYDKLYIGKRAYKLFGLIREDTKIIHIIHVIHCLRKSKHDIRNIN